MIRQQSWPVKHLNACIRVEASVRADAHLTHEKLADLLGFDFKELVTSAGERVKEGIYHIQHVTTYRLWYRAKDELCNDEYRVFGTDFGRFTIAFFKTRNGVSFLISRTFVRFP